MYVCIYVYRYLDVDIFIHAEHGSANVQNDTPVRVTGNWPPPRPCS